MSITHSITSIAEFELKSSLLRGVAQDLKVVDVLLQTRAAYLEVTHARGTESLPIAIPQLSEVLMDKALHFCRSRRRSERHPQPLVQSWANANHQQLPCLLEQEELRVSPDCVN